MYYSYLEGGSNSSGGIGLIEYFINPRFSYDYEVTYMADFLSDSSQQEYGKYFQVDSDTNKLFISSYLDSNNDSIHSIDVVQLCTIYEEYSSTLNTCSDLSSGSIVTSLDGQTSEVCSSIDDTVERTRFLAESVCNFTCDDYLFGKDCEVCSDYMTRVGAELLTDYEWNDDSPAICNEISSITSYEQCEEIYTCSKCIKANSCQYDNFQCSTSDFAPGYSSIADIHDLCESYGVVEHDITICGESDYELGNIEGFNHSIKPETYTPRNTLCVYKITTGISTTINDYFTISLESDMEIVIEQESNGVVTTVDPTQEIFGNRRNLVESSFSINNADAVYLYYMNSDIETEASLTFTTETDYSSQSSDATGSSMSAFGVVFMIISICAI